MHQALQVQEILLNIFGHCCTTRRAIDLPALARTCRAFKEPALDVLWESLSDPSPLARCLPEASQHSQTSPWRKCYSFNRMLTQVEQDIFLNYARRIRSMEDNTGKLDWKSVWNSLNPHTIEPLFPNLRYLHCSSAIKAKHLLCTPFPSLIFLSLGLRDEEDFKALQRPLESFSKFSENIRGLSIHFEQLGVTVSKSFSDCICRWQNLQTVDCDSIALDMDGLSHLSRMSALMRLKFTVSPALPDRIVPSCSLISFSDLRELTLHAELLEPISRLLSRIRLPVITSFKTFIQSCPSQLDVSSFSATIQTCDIARTIQVLLLKQGFCTDSDYVARNPRSVLGPEGLQPFMAFSGLRRITLDIEWIVKLADEELLALVPAWPHLEVLAINDEWGWKTQGGITPDGLLRLLQTCPSLNWVTLAMDTRGYTRFHQTPASSRLTFGPTFGLNVVDSVIALESVPAITAFLTNIALHSNFSLHAWGGSGIFPNVMEYEYMDLWHEVHTQVANNTVTKLHDAT